MERLRESQKKEPYEETLTNEKPRDKTTTAPEDLLEMALVSQYEQEAKKLVEYFEQYTLCKGRLEMIRKVAAVQGIHLPEAYGL